MFQLPNHPEVRVQDGVHNRVNIVHNRHNMAGGKTLIRSQSIQDIEKTPEVSKNHMKDITRSTSLRIHTILEVHHNLIQFKLQADLMETRPLREPGQAVAKVPHDRGMMEDTPLRAADPRLEISLGLHHLVSSISTQFKLDADLMEPPREP